MNENKTRMLRMLTGGLLVLSLAALGILATRYDGARAEETSSSEQMATLSPTPTLTPTPTPEPTEEPTPEPTEEPTPEPTEEPTPEPTEEPTPEPTEEPTPEPTEEPTPEPTEEPTPEPTEEPTPEPTEEPTPEPTEEPTPEPTEEPTPEPTEEPTPEPTEAPVSMLIAAVKLARMQEATQSEATTLDYKDDPEALGLKPVAVESISDETDDETLTQAYSIHVPATLTVDQKAREGKFSFSVSNLDTAVSVEIDSENGFKLVSGDNTAAYVLSGGNAEKSGGKLVVHLTAEQSETTMKIAVDQTQTEPGDYTDKLTFSINIP